MTQTGKIRGIEGMNSMKEVAKNEQKIDKYVNKDD